MTGIKNPRLVLTVLLIGALSVTSVTVPLWVSWYDQRVELHMRWATQYREATVFSWQMQDVVPALGNASFSSDRALQNWASSTLWEAFITTNAMENLDPVGGSQINEIGQDLYYMSKLPYLLNMTSQQRSMLAGDVRLIGGKVVTAYYTFQNVTFNVGSGPPFDYSGPTPPDMQLLNQAVSLADHPPGAPPPICGTFATC